MIRPIRFCCLLAIFSIFGCYYASNSPANNPVKAKQSENGENAPLLAENSGFEKELIEKGTDLKTALAILDRAGAVKEAIWQWAWDDKDTAYKGRYITEKIALALFYSESTQKIKKLQMIYTPPVINMRGNYCVVEAISINFHRDKTYTVHFDKP